MRSQGRWALTALLLLAGCADKNLQFADAGPVAVGDASLTPTVDAGVEPGIDAAVGTPGRATLSGAVKASSPNYKLYGSLRSGDGSSASPNYQRRGGVIGATQP